MLHSCRRDNAPTLTGHEFFPHLISGPFHHGLVIVFTAAAAMALVAAVASLLRGPRTAGPPQPVARPRQTRRDRPKDPAGHCS